MKVLAVTKKVGVCGAFQWVGGGWEADVKVK